ncbi:MAG: hypothetical protein A2138_17245 [Deltaproteobacteria bacterium RBG_16_71_12]|nr:MAG: hypothetical protein A2138_17245 [Deltaproteobacteria bacterium RBG_16_71_12]
MPIEIANKANVGQTHAAEELTKNALGALEMFAANGNRELVSVPPVVLESMALAIQQLTEKGNLLGAENKNLRADLEKAQAALAAKAKESKHEITGNWAYSFYNVPRTVQYIEAAATKFGLDDRSVTWSGSTINIKVAGPTAAVAKLQEWIKYWAEDSGHTRQP